MSPEKEKSSDTTNQAQNFEENTVPQKVETDSFPAAAVPPGAGQPTKEVGGSVQFSSLPIYVQQDGFIQHIPQAQVPEQHSLSTETVSTPVSLQQETSTPAITDIPPAEEMRTTKESASTQFVQYTDPGGGKAFSVEGEQYVTVIQDGQTYAMSVADYEAMLGRVDSGEMSANPQNISTSEPEKQEKEEDAVSMRFLSAGAFDTPQTKRKIVPNLSLTRAVSNPGFRPIKVDNWGIFLLNRLQSCFQRKEFCDLTIRFPDKNAQIKVHKLVVNACTEFFLNAEKEGELKEGIMDMPSSFLPEAMAPIIRFMYTGRLEVKEESFSRLYETAALLNMSVLTKLMDAQAATLTELSRKGSKRKTTADDDPLNQVKKFRKIAEIVKQEEERAQKVEKLKTLYKIKHEQDELEKQKLPGKKLPIWKKRNFGGESGSGESSRPSYVTKITDAQQRSEGQVETNLEEISSKAAPSFPYKIPKLSDSQDASSADTRKMHVQATYERKISPDKPKIPRKLREIQEHLMFEKILKTGSKNTLMNKQRIGEGRSLSAEEIKELGEQQAQRIGVDDDDDYFDNDAELTNDDYLEEIDYSPSPIEPINEDQPTNITSIQTKEEKELTPDPARKTLKFSMKPDPCEFSISLRSQPAPVEENKHLHFQSVETKSNQLTSTPAKESTSGGSATVNPVPRSSEAQPNPIDSKQSGEEYLLPDRNTLELELDDALEQFSREDQ